MNRPIEDVYFDWLCGKVKVERFPSYLELFRILHSHVFPDETGLDENRVEDAKELREMFLNERRLRASHFWLSQEASVLEILVSFAEKAAFQIELPISSWFWQFITNLQLDDFRRVIDSDREIIQDRLDTFVLRRYDDHGNGGLFPLRRANRDQREVEIWYQFCDYVVDNGLMYGLI